MAQIELIEVATEDLCPGCGGMIVMVANGNRPEIDLDCDCGGAVALS